MLKHLKSVLALVFIIALLAGGCTSDNASGKTEDPRAESNSDGKKVVTDILDRKVEISNDVKTIGVTPIPYASMIYAIDGTAERLVAINPSAKKAYEMSMLTKLAPEMGKVSSEYIATDFSINIEEIVNLKPDVMIVWSRQEAEIKKLEDLGIPVVSLTNGASSNIEDMRSNMRIVGQILGKEEQAEKLISYNKDVEKDFKAKAEQISANSKSKVLFLRDKNLKASASKSFNQIMIELAGGVNVASEVPGSWTKLSMEQILEWDPDIIYLSNFDDFEPEDLYENKIKGQDWSNVTAVKNKKVYKTPLGIYRWDAPNAETPLFLKWMGKQQQPEIFSDYDLEKDIISFYKEFFDYDLSREEVAFILKKEINGN